MVNISKLNPREYEHPFDKKALDALEKTRGMETLVKKFYEYGIERLFNIQCTGSHLKVTPSSLPAIYDMVEQSCEVLFLPSIPDIYIQNSEHFQGLVTGVDNPIIILSSAAIEHLSELENRFLIGRLIGHIKSEHVLYYEIGHLLPFIIQLLAGPTLGLGSILTQGLQMALLHWKQMSEYSVDRAGLLSCQDVGSAMSALAKIAGLPKKYYDHFNVDDFVTQSRRFEGYDESGYDKALKYASLVFNDESHWAVERANQLLQWIDNGEYQNVLERKVASNNLNPQMLFCSNCGNSRMAEAKFCVKCGNKFNV